MTEEHGKGHQNWVCCMVADSQIVVVAVNKVQAAGAHTFAVDLEVDYHTLVLHIPVHAVHSYVVRGQVVDIELAVHSQDLVVARNSYREGLNDDLLVILRVDHHAHNNHTLL